ncbi:MAG: PilT/PilU family type 4a pilus ATPase [Coriobacteriales bacterium]|jgi:twitching motility protein PilT|nr:PilT/PilU family type 4a pilus ATPase [Coriobacteriales bacterium]
MELQAELKSLLKDMIDAKASDIFVVTGRPMAFTSSGTLKQANDTVLKPADTRRIIESIYQLADRDFSLMANNVNHDEDFSFAISGIGRFRANVFRQRGSYSAVIRVIPFGLPDPADLGIPEEVLDLAKLQKGLVLVTGSASSGKSTTLACIVDRMNHERPGHIITLEDPIEYVHRHGTCIVTQREIPTDVATYAEALRSALRQSPDIILLGEMRDPETVSTAMTAAETAQLLFSTLHTTSAAGTVDRIVDSFPAVQQHQIRIQLSLVLQAIVCQQLVPTVDGGQVPAFEIMISNPAIRNLIRERKTHQIDSVIAAGSAVGMRTMDQSLFQLAKEGRITADTAVRFSIHEEPLTRRLEREGLL